MGVIQGNCTNAGQIQDKYMNVDFNTACFWAWATGMPPAQRRVYLPNQWLPGGRGSHPAQETRARWCLQWWPAIRGVRWRQKCGWRRKGRWIKWLNKKWLTEKVHYGKLNYQIVFKRVFLSLCFRRHIIHLEVDDAECLILDIFKCPIVHNFLKCTGVVQFQTL